MAVQLLVQQQQEGSGFESSLGPFCVHLACFPMSAFSLGTVRGHVWMGVPVAL